MEAEQIDLGESALMKKILEGGTTAIIFFLKTKGKDRGYVERKQYETDKGDPKEFPRLKEIVPKPRKNGIGNAK